MSFKIRAVLASALAIGFMVGTSNAAQASYQYTLSGNGIFSYITSSNNLNIQDVKQGDTLYVRYKFTGTVTGSRDSAGAPSSYSTLRATGGANPHTERHDLDPGNFAYVLLQFCQDDTPPDTCSSWKWTEA